MQGNVLAQLKAIHLPPAIGFWPLAPGWYFVIALVIVAAVVGLLFLNRKWLLRQRKQAILQQIDQLQHLAEHQPAKAIAELSILLRRTTLDKFPRQDIAGLHGEQWLRFLDQHCPKALQEQQAFSHGAGKILITAPYQANLTLASEEIFVLVKQWINHNA